MPSASFELRSLLDRAEVEDIVLKPAGLAYFAEGRWHGPFESADCAPEALERLARHVAEAASVQLGPAQPAANAFLNMPGDRAFRAHAAVAPLLMNGPEISLRRLPTAGRFRLEDFEAADGQIARVRARFAAGASVLVAGTTGSGKTSFAAALLAGLPTSTRVLVLEDSPELPLPNALSTRLLARTDRYGYRLGATWELSDLVYESLRMRPDRLVIGECRGREAEALVHARQTGHAGLLTTIHASSPAEARARFFSLAGPLAGEGGAAWDLVVQLRQDENGRRRLIACEESP
jgi:pilus assembly protein CpaF